MTDPKQVVDDGSDAEEKARRHYDENLRNFHGWARLFGLLPPLPDPLPPETITPRRRRSRRRPRLVAKEK
jgi:hypothetical protein